MTQWDKFRRKLLSGQSDKNISFTDLCRYVERLGFEERSDGSGGSHKVYQVKQVRRLIQNYTLIEPGD